MELYILDQTDENFYAVNPDGSQKWVFSEVEDVYASAAIGSDGTIYVGSDSDIFYALNPDGSKSGNLMLEMKYILLLL